MKCRAKRLLIFPRKHGKLARMHIRQATKDDLLAIHEVDCHAIQELCAPAYPSETLQQWLAIKTLAELEQSFAKQHTVYFVAEDTQGVQGAIARHYSEIIRLCVNPAKSGSGIGKKLLMAAEKNAQQQDLAWLQVNSTLNAVAFYASQGYQKRQHFEVERGENLRIAVVKMDKTL